MSPFLLAAAPTGTKAAENKEAQPEKQQETLLPPLAAAERAAAAARALETKLDTALSNQRVEATLKTRAGAPAYQRLYQAYQAELPADIGGGQAVLKRTSLPESASSCHRALAPEDPKRPGLLITFPEKESAAVDQCVTELREKTTSALLWSGGFGELKKTRANSTLIPQVQEVLDKEVAAAEKRLDYVRRYAAAEALLSVEEKMGRGQFATAAEHADKAAAGKGPEQSTFDEHVAARKADCLRLIREKSSEITQLAAEHAKQFACGKAAEYKKKGEDDGMPIHLLGVEVDFRGRRPVGIEYYVITTEGKTYLLANVGKNFQVAEGEMVPAKAYADFNVAVLRSYQENSGISRDELYSIAMAKGFYPVEEGKIFYLNPSRGKKEVRAIGAKLAEIYAEKEMLTEKNWLDAAKH
jgi:hypothetical protein